MHRYITLALILISIITTSPPANAKALQSAYGLDDTVRKLVPSVVLIVGIGDQINLGSGFIISDDGRIVTNQHVINGAKNIYAVWDSTVKRPFEECRLLHEDKGLDIALLQLPGDGYQPLRIAPVDKAEIADDIICLGFPIVDSNDFRNDTFNVAVTRGIISSIQRDREGDIAEIWTDAAITYGNSGGPLYDLDLDGVIGINNLFADKAKGNYNLAIPYTRFESVSAGWENKMTLPPILVTRLTPEQALDEAVKLHDAGKLDESIESLEKNIKGYSDADTITLRLKLGEWYKEAQRYADAFAAYEGLGNDRPGDDTFVISYGIVAYQAEKYNRAVEILLPLILLNNDNVYIILALSYFELKQNTEASTYAKLALGVTKSDQVKFLADKVLEGVKGDSGK